MRKKLFFSFLYFAEGAPIGFIWWTIPAILAEKNLPLAEISTLMALATLPWSFKFIFAPFIDILSHKRIGLKKQLAVFQSLMAISALSFGPLIVDYNFTYLAIALVVHALSAASQDICIDALAIKSVPNEEMGSVNGYMQAGRLVGTAIFGGFGIYIANQYGVYTLSFILAGAVGLALFTISLADFSNKIEEALSISRYFKDLKILASMKKTWLLLAISFLACFSFKGIDGIASASLVNLGIDADYRALFYGVAVPVLTLIGALSGGYISDRISKAKALKSFLIIMVVANLFLAYTFDTSLSLIWISAALAFFYLMLGFTMTSLYAYLMNHSSKEFAAFEFSTFMAMVNLCESFNTYLAGQFSPVYGFLPVSAALVAVSVLILPLTRMVRKLA